ncbi:MAG: nucleotide sugar dehydrogenase [Oscillospiraceae bacterium]|nr:nucleotide sugar dehydrogenase [Oscillospiraceae bacterium]
MYAEGLMQKILKKTAVLGVVGLGYVGLPLAVEKAKAGYQVTGFDLQAKKVTLVNAGESYIGDVAGKELRELVEAGRLRAQHGLEGIEGCDCVAICVPTPLDRYAQPDLSYVRASAEETAKRLRHGRLVVLESTTYPGTTEEVVYGALKKAGFEAGKDVFVAFSPERVDPGNRLYHTGNTPKVVGGLTPECTRLAAALYGQVLKGEIHTVSSPRVAEMEKILENTFRSLNIALANEMAVLCHRMEIPVWEVIDAAKTKPYGFMAFYPGPGLGGHCIPVDPYYLTWKAREYGYHTRLIELAGEINSGMPEYVTGRISEMLNRHGKSLSGAKLLLLGLTFKADVGDLRESPALKVLELLEKSGCQLAVHDPFYPELSLGERRYISVDLGPESLEGCDMAVVLTAHSVYDPQMIARHAKLVFDTRNLTKGIRRSGIERL